MTGRPSTQVWTRSLRLVFLVVRPVSFLPTTTSAKPSPVTSRIAWRNSYSTSSSSQYWVDFSISTKSTSSSKWSQQRADHRPLPGSNRNEARLRVDSHSQQLKYWKTTPGTGDGSNEASPRNLHMKSASEVRMRSFRPVPRS